MFEGLTNKGKQHMAKCLAENKPISFVKVKIGDGNIMPGDNPEAFTDIKSLKKEVSIADKTQEGETVKLLVQIDNAGLETGYFPREIGIYVQDGNQEILYWYINDGTETSWLPPASKSPVKFKYWVNLMATNLETVIVNWSGKELWVDQDWLNTNTVTVEEVRNMFNKQFVYDTFELATEADIRNLFTNTRLEGQAKFDLSSLSATEATIVNMKLLSLFNDLLQQRMNADNNSLSTSLNNLINSTKTSLEELIKLKANITDVDKIKETLENAISLKVATETFNTIVNSLNENINKKVNQTTTVAGEGALSGGGALSRNIEITHKDASGYKHIPTGGRNKSFLIWVSDGTAKWADINLINLGIEVVSLEEIRQNFNK